MERPTDAGPVALAVSGGVDSLALLLLASAAWPGGVIAATVDHGLRPAAAHEADMVAQACGDRAVPHAILRVVVPREGIGIQAGARRARYAALGRWAAAAGATCLATAHHADDQAETLLMRLGRGSGIGGLAGVRRSRPLDEAPGVTLFRPLLGWRKAALAGVVADAGLAPIEDPSNADPRHDRTHFRALLAREPLLAVERLAATAAHLAEADAALAWAAGEAWTARARAEGDGWTLRIDGLPAELRRRLLAHAIGPTRGDDLSRLIAALETNRAATLAGFVVRPEVGDWRITRAPFRRIG